MSGSHAWGDQKIIVVGYSGKQNGMAAEEQTRDRGITVTNPEKSFEQLEACSSSVWGGVLWDRNNSQESD